MFEELLKQWANEQGFDGWSQDHAAVLRNLSKWLNMHAVEHLRALDEDECAVCHFEYQPHWDSCPNCGAVRPHQ